MWKLAGSLFAYAARFSYAIRRHVALRRRTAIRLLLIERCQLAAIHSVSVVLPWTVRFYALHKLQFTVMLLFFCCCSFLLLPDT